MKDLLSRISRCVENDPITVFPDSQVLGDLPGSEEDVAQEISFFFGDVIQRRDVLFGYDQNVDRCLRIDIIEGDDAIVLKNELSRNTLADNFAKQAIFHFGSLCSFLFIL
jgi:hypothetical protein